VEHGAENRHFDMFIMAINATLAGLGIALLPRILIERELCAGTLVQVHSHAVANPETIYYAFPEQKRGWEPLRRFERWLLAAMGRDGASGDGAVAAVG
jgi:DNA-binding transcriptional LysR family regulator